VTGWHETKIDMDLHKVLVIGYRDFAGTACPAEGIICLDEDENVYADSQGKVTLILAGLETQDCALGCGPELASIWIKSIVLFLFRSWLLPLTKI
jgi:hypothetical protein